MTESTNLHQTVALDLGDVSVGKIGDNICIYVNNIYFNGNGVV